MSAEIIEFKKPETEKPLSRQDEARRRLKLYADHFTRLARAEWVRRMENLKQ